MEAPASFPCPAPSEVELTHYVDATFARLTFAVRLGPLAAGSSRRVETHLRTPVGARDFAFASPSMCLEGMTHATDADSVNDEAGYVLSGRDRAAAALPRADLHYMDRDGNAWTALTTGRRLRVEGGTASGTLIVVMEPDGPALPADFIFHITFRLAALNWEFYHELALATEYVNHESINRLSTFVRTEGSMDLFAAYLRQACDAGRPPRVTRAFVNARIHESARRALAEKSARDGADETAAPRAAAAYAPRVAADAIGRWAVRDTELRVGDAERVFRGVSSNVALSQFNVFDRDDGEGQPELRAAFTFSPTIKPPAIETGRLVVTDHATGVMLGGAGAFNTAGTRVLRVGALHGVTVRVARVVDNKAERYHEEAVTVTNARSAPVKVSLVQRGAAKVELLERGRARDTTVRTTLAAEPLLFEATDEGAPQGFIVPISAAPGETVVHYRWFRASGQ